MLIFTQTLSKYNLVREKIHKVLDLLPWQLQGPLKDASKSQLKRQAASPHLSIQWFSPLQAFSPMFASQCIRSLSTTFTLTAALIDSPMFMWDGKFQEASYDLIFTAKQLRHSGLFRECFVHIVATWVDGFNTSPKSMPRVKRVAIIKNHRHGQGRLVNDPELMPLISAAHIDLCRALLSVNQELIIKPVEIKVGFEESDSGACKSRKPSNKLQATQNAQYYRELDKHLSRDPENYSLHRRVLQCAMRVLLRNNLRFDKTGRGAGWGIYEQCFLCADVSDDDLPVSSHQSLVKTPVLLFCASPTNRTFFRSCRRCRRTNLLIVSGTRKRSISSPRQMSSEK